MMRREKRFKERKRERKKKEPQRKGKWKNNLREKGKLKKEKLIQ
jgi:hypothetical protein